MERELISDYSCVDFDLFEKYPDKPGPKVMANKNIKLVDIINILENKVYICFIKGKFVVKFRQKLILVYKIMRLCMV